jgi:hypothetical protein
MSTAPPASVAWLQRGALAYMIICLCALLLLFQVFQEREAGPWSFFPVFVGSAGVFLRWGIAPLALLAAIVLTMLVEPNRMLFVSHAGFRVPDFLLCAAVMAYVLAHYRLTLIRAPFPPERPHAKPNPPPTVQREQPEDAFFISSRETGLLLLSLPLWAGLAQVVWPLLPRTVGNPGLIGPVWRVVAFLWLVGGIGLIMASAFDYAYRRRMSKEEATLYLQDLLWRETRGEQRRINRWFAWGRIKGRPTLWEDVRANRRVLLVILIVDLIVVLLFLGLTS